MRILSFNTSSANLYACLADGSSIVANRSITCNAQDRQFTASLIIPTIGDLLKDSNWKKEEIEAITVGIGPGSFTGIRIAVVTARTLCQALNLPLIGINEFECHAFNEQISEFPFVLALDASKNQFYCAHINSGTISLNDQKLMKKYIRWEMDYHHIKEEELKSHLKEFKQVFLPSKPDVSSHTAKCSEPSAINNPAINQALLANLRLNESMPIKQPLNDIFPYHSVKPLYIRNASITISPRQSQSQI